VGLLQEQEKSRGTTAEPGTVRAVISWE